MTAEVLLYNEIGSSGVGAGDFINDLRAANGPVHLRVNSPGGDVFDGVAIHNAIVSHPHDVTVTVDSLAASAASFVAMAGTTVQMQRGAQMMIHDAWGGQVGNAAEMRRTADLLDGFSNQIAGIYASRAGGSIGQWRDAMRRETWYNADEAVAAGLADKVVTPAGRVRNAITVFDLGSRGWRYAGRDAAPPPTLRNADSGLSLDDLPDDQDADVSDDDHDQALDAILLDLYRDVHHLMDLCEAVHDTDDGSDDGDAMQALYRLFQPQAAHLGFAKLTAQLSAHGATNPRALAAYIGRKKLGGAEMAARAAASRARHAAHTSASNQLADFDPDLFRRLMEGASK